MRKRINRVVIASSDNYLSSKRAHTEYLKEQHRFNRVILMSIAERPVDELKRFELGVKQQISAYKERIL